MATSGGIKALAQALATYGRGRFWIPLFVFLSICAVCITVLMFPRCAQAYGPYNGEVVEVYDGDTVKMEIAVYPRMTSYVSVRIRGIQAPEIRTRRQCEKMAGKKSRDYLAMVLKVGEVYPVIEVAEGTYPGRIIADIVVEGVRVSEFMLASGMAIRYGDQARAPDWQCS